MDSTTTSGANALSETPARKDGLANAGGSPGAGGVAHAAGSPNADAPAPASAPTRKGGVDGFTLKVIAIIGMTANHVSHVLGSMMPWQVTLLLHSLGGVTFAIMAFLMVEGYLHTSNLRRYAARLFVFALISQVPFSLCFGAHANVLFTLLMGLFLLWAWDTLTSRGPALKCAFALLFAAVTAISYFCDWAIIGPAIVLLFYLTRRMGTRGVLLTMALPYAYTIIKALVVLVPELQSCLELGEQVVARGMTDAYRMMYVAGTPVYLSAKLLGKCASIGYALVGFTIATVCICNYNGERGRSMKWLFYAYYPAHLAVIWGVKQLLSIGS